VKKNNASVIIVGSWPVGLLIALRLGQGIPTVVLECHDTLLPITKAVAYMLVVTLVLHDLGILLAVQSSAFLNHHGVA